MYGPFFFLFSINIFAFFDTMIEKHMHVYHHKHGPCAPSMLRSPLTAHATVPGHTLSCSRICDLRPFSIPLIVTAKISHVFRQKKIYHALIQHLFSVSLAVIRKDLTRT
jgi:hypothetical protein